MNKKQRLLFAVYLPMTFIILILDNIYPGKDAVQYLKYATMITLFLFVSSMRKKYREQKTMALAFFFMVLADNAKQSHSSN
jgi:hypothetical protein